MEAIYISLTGIISLMTLLFGIRVFQADRKSAINRSFALFTLITSIWLLLDFATYQQSLANFQTLFYKIIFAVIILMVFALAIFINYFPKTYVGFNNFLKLIISIVILILVALSLFTKSIVDYAYMEGYGSNFQQGKYFIIFIIYVSALSLFILIALINKYIKSQGEEKVQLKYLLYGLSIFVFLNLAFNLFIPMLTGSFIYGRIGTYSSIFFVGFIAYAILKTHLFNLRIILTETAAVIINVISVVSIFTSNTLTEGLLRALFATFIFYGSYILLKSVRREIEQKEELEVITDELSKANEKLQAIDAMKTEFVSMASHELLTPISAIEGYLSMMLDEKMVKIDDPKAAEYMDRVYKSAKRLARLVADLLNVSRIEEGRLLVEKKDIELEELVTSVVDELKFKAEGAKVKLEKEISDETKVKLYADPDKIKEVIINLCGNSIKYTHENGFAKITAMIMPTDEVLKKFDAMSYICKQNGEAQTADGSIQTAVHEKYKEMVGNKQVVFSVEDNGVGIEPCDIPKLFKKFSRVGDWSTQEVQGTGLGLYISRSLVEMHHGKIWVESAGKDKGSTFYFSLPLFETKAQVVKLDSEVPKAKDAKPLAKSAVGS